MCFRQMLWFVGSSCTSRLASCARQVSTHVVESIAEK